MKVSVFGNPDVKIDSLVVGLVSELKLRLPEVEFIVEDPSEGLKPPKGGVWVILDVATGIDEIKVFEDLSKLSATRKSSLHDYDVAMELLLLKKIGRLVKVKIVAVPIEMEREKAFKEIINILESS